MSEEGKNAEDKTPGIFSWQELISQDVEASTAFYSTLLGWTVETMDMGGGKSYSMFKIGERPIAGMMGTPAEKSDIPTTWVSYITVEDLDATVAKAVELGAKICVPPTEIPGKGRFSNLIDPQRAPIAFWEFTAEASVDC